MKGVQCRSRSKKQCSDVQADFVCKLEKQRVDPFESLSEYSPFESAKWLPI